MIKGVLIQRLYTVSNGNLNSGNVKTRDKVYVVIIFSSRTAFPETTV